MRSAQVEEGPLCRGQFPQRLACAKLSLLNDASSPRVALPVSLTGFEHSCLPNVISHRNTNQT